MANGFDNVHVQQTRTFCSIKSLGAFNNYPTFINTIKRPPAFTAYHYDIYIYMDLTMIFLRLNMSVEKNIYQRQSREIIFSFSISKNYFFYILTDFYRNYFYRKKHSGARNFVFSSHEYSSLLNH